MNKMKMKRGYHQDLVLYALHLRPHTYLRRVKRPPSSFEYVDRRVETTHLTIVPPIQARRMRVSKTPLTMKRIHGGKTREVFAGMR